MINKIILLTTLLSSLFAVNTFALQDGHSYDAGADCDINAGPCAKTVEHENIRVVFDISPKPVSPMKELLFSVVLHGGEKTIADAKVGLDLTMPGMFMGVNRPVLSNAEDGRYEGKGIIPVCPHGGKLWKADVTVERDGRSSTVSYLFEVQ